MKKMLLPIIAVCCLAPAAVFAGQQHPLITDMAETVAPKRFEAETAVEYFTDKNSGVKSSEFVLQETVTGGIIPKLDGFITLPFKSDKTDGVDRESGFGDVTLGVKWGFAHVDKAAFAVKPFIVLPTGDEDTFLGEGGIGIGAVAVASLELEKGLAVDANLMLKHQDTKNDSYNEFGISVAGKFDASKELKIVAELAASKPDYDGAKWATILTAGAIYAAQKNIDVDLGLRVGLTDDTTADLGVLAGLTFKF